jgi:hypothetical protein
MKFKLRHLCIIIIPYFISGAIQAQNLEGLSNQKPITLSGGLTAKAIFYDANGIANRRQPFSYIFTGSPTISILNSLTIPFSFTYSEQDRSFRQPFNQFGMSPYYKWITFHAGYRNINYSQFTLAGHTFLGAGVDLHPGIFRLGFISGRFSRATPVDTSSKSFQPFTYSNHGIGAKIGLGKGSNFFDISMLRAKDDSTSVRPKGEYTGTVTPAENIVIGINGQIKFFKDFLFSLEAATSLYTRNLMNKSALSDGANKGITKLLGNFISTNGTTERYNAIQTSLAYHQKIFSAKLQYRRVDPDYKSMGGYFFNNDIENITFAPSLNILKNKVRFGGSIGFQHDNLKKQKQTTSSRTIGSSNLSADFNEHFGIDLTYSNYSNTQLNKTIFLGNTFRIAQVSKNFSFTPRYILANEKFVHSIVLSANYNVFSSVDKTIDNLSDTKSKNYFLNYQLTVVPVNLTYTFNLNYTDVKSAAYMDGNYGLTLGVNKVLKDSKLTLGWLGSFLKGLHGQSTGLILNQNINMSYRINKHNSFGTTISYINNKSQQTVFSPSYSEWQADITYRYAF